MIIFVIPEKALFVLSAKSGTKSLKTKLWTGVNLFALLLYASSLFSQTTQTFNYTGGAQSYTVPAGVTSIAIKAWGAQGGTLLNAGGSGGYATGILGVSPNQVLYVYVGEQPTTATGGFNGGGAGLNDGISRGGGGASDVRISGYGLSERVIVAAGGGGATNQAVERGGYGGGVTGGDGVGAEGYAGDGYCGHGATQTAGGAGSVNYGKSTAGSWGQGGNALLAMNNFGGGGGGGYYGGGAGDHGGGGGGSSYVGGLTSSISTTADQRSGNGLVTITYGASSTIITTGELSVFSTCSGTASSSQNFSVSGSGLSNNITITAPTGFEVSKTSGTSGFASSVSLTQSGGTVSSTTIYVRLTNTATGTPSGNISLASDDATTQTLAATGTVTTASVGGTAKW